MGAWGYGPFDNDHAGDAITDAVRGFFLKLLAKSKRQRIDIALVEVRALHALMADSAHLFLLEELVEVNDTLAELASSEKAKVWLKSWDSPAAISLALRAQFHRLGAIIDDRKSKAEARDARLKRHTKRRVATRKRYAHSRKPKQKPALSKKRSKR